MAEPPKTPEGLDQFPPDWGVTGLNSPREEEKRTLWHLYAKDYWDVPIGSQYGETLDEAVRNLHGKWNGMGGFFYDETNLRRDEDGVWYYRDREIFGKKEQG